MSIAPTLAPMLGREANDLTQFELRLDDGIALSLVASTPPKLKHRVGTHGAPDMDEIAARFGEAELYCFAPTERKTAG